jgi:hypothetical protein
VDTCATIKVKPWGKDQGDFVEINATDFNPDVHEMLDGETETDVATADEIRAALDMLVGDDDKHWTAAGLPAVDAVAELVGKPVTRAAIEAVAPDMKRPAPNGGQ